MIPLNQKIKQIRELKNYTQEYMATQLKITQAAYSKIEGGQDITYSKITEIAKIFELSTQELMAWDSQKYFNSFNNVKGSNNGSVTIQLKDETIKKLYEDKITLLSKLLEQTENELNKFKNKFGDI